MTLNLSLGKITADKATFNSIALALYDSRDLDKLKAKEAKEAGDERKAEIYNSCAKVTQKDINIIHYALEAKGYFDDI